MARERLRALLVELEGELDESGGIDAPTAELLRGAKQDIEDALDRDEPAHAAEGVRQRVTDAVDRLEDAHPRTVAVLQRVLDALSNVGI